MELNANNNFRLFTINNLLKIIFIKLAPQKLALQNYFHWNEIQKVWELFITPLKPHNPCWVVVWRMFHSLLFALQKLEKLRRSLTKEIIPVLGMASMSIGEVQA